MAEKEILVIPRGKLFSDGETPQGFINNWGGVYDSRILKNFEFRKRSEMEQNPDFKQPIAYSLIINSALGKAFAYQRSTIDKNYGEKRLQGKWSLGIGGHIERVDGTVDPLTTSMLRELKEEAGIVPIISPTIIGYINDESNSVGKVHFGVVYAVLTDQAEIKPADEEITNAGLRSLVELDNLIERENVEDWSKLVYPKLTKLLLSLEE